METNEIFEEGGEGNFVSDGAWIPEEHRGEKCLESIKDFSSLVKLGVEGQKLAGKKGLTVPGEGASEDEINAFHIATGRPEKASDYKFEKAKLPEGMVADEKMEGVFRDIAYKNGLNNKAASAIVAGINNYMIDGYNTNKKAIEDNQKASVEILKKVWGKDYDANFKLAENAFKAFAPDEETQAMFGELGNNPAIIKTFVKIGQAMSEDKLKGIAGGGVGVDAIKKIREIKLDPKHPFNKANDAKHDEAVAEMQILYKAAYPDKAPEGE